MSRFALFFTVLCTVGTFIVANNNTQVHSLSDIFEFLEENSKNFKLGEQRDVVLVLGNTGSGKSTLTLLLTGVELIAIETDEGSDEFVVKDKNRLISSPEQTTQSQTIIPNLLVDSEYHTSYYDCAGFENSKGLEHDISVTYLIQKLLQYADSVKFVFTVAYSSVKIGGDRHDFKKLARHATALIKNLDKFRNAIALVVTKVETKISNGQIVNDEKIIENIAKFLNQTLSDLNSENEAIREKITNFIKILLQKDGDKFNRIQILRTPTKSGSFNEMPLQMEERFAIRSMLNNTIQNVYKENNDFGHTISTGSKLRVHDLFEELEHSLTDNVICIGNEIIKFYEQEEAQTADKRTLLSNIMLVNEMLPQINADDPKLFKDQMIKAISELHINISADSLYDSELEFVHLLGSVTDGKLSNFFKISNGLKNISKNFSKSMEYRQLELIFELKANLTKDVSNIDAEIKSFYLQMEAHISDINVLYEKTQSAYDKLAKITSKEPGLFLTQITEYINSLHIKMADTLKQFSKHIEVISFLESLNNGNLPQSIAIENGLTTTLQYLSESMQWYKFMSDLHNILSEFKVQQNIEQYNAIALRNTINRLIEHAERENSQIFFEDTGINEFIGRISDKTNIELENIQLNTLKLKSFNHLLEQSMIIKIRPLCTPDVLIVKGNFIKTSELINIQCEAKLIKLLAFVKIFIDADVNQAGKELHIISPSWEIVNERSINLSGQPGESYNHSASNGDKGMPGKAGEPGKPGKSAGHFFGIGDSFTNGQNLTIFVNGGMGGAGQNGGNGGDGDNGYIYVSKWLYFDQPGRKSDATPSGNGGDGGCGGLGGLSGKIFIVGLQELNIKSLFNSSGNEGPAGRGGKSKPTSDKYFDFKNIDCWQILRYAPSAGKNGKNCASRFQPNELLMSPFSYTVNEYKNYIRENLVNNIWESNLRAFLEDIENSKDVQSVYNILSFMNEIIGLENQYFQLRNKFEFRSSFMSILNRLNIYDKTLAESDPIRKVLRYLYAAMLSKINSNISNQKTIFNLRDYLNEAQTHINEIRVIGREKQIQNHQIQYKNSLNIRMDSAKDLINIKLLPELNRNLNLIESNFVNLVDGTLQQKKQAAIEEYKQKQSEMKRSIFEQKLLSGLKIMSTALSFFGPVGQGVGAILGAGTAIAEAAMSKKVTQSTIARVSTSIYSLVKALKSNQNLFEQQLDDIKYAISANNKYKNEFKELQVELQKIQADVEKANKEGAFLPIVEARKKLQNLVMYKKIDIEKQKPQEHKLIQVMNKVQDIAQIIGMSVDMYNRIKNNAEQMHEVADVIRSLEIELMAIEQYEEPIYKTMIPLFHAIENYLKMLNPSLDNGSHVQLDIRKWEIKNRLVDVKLMFSQMTDVSAIHDDFQHYFEKVQATMDVLIDVYDRIESISEHSKFVDFITQIATSNGKDITNDPMLIDSIKKMDEIIQTNLILERHSFVVHAFKQHYFPFAPLFLDKFNLPSQLCFNDTDALKENAIAQIKDLNSGVIISDSTLGIKDINLFSDITFDSDDTISVLPPFYIWKHNEYKKEVQKLLRGEEIYIKADIMKGINKNAIKFKQIGIYLNSPDETIQMELNEAINNFDLTMEMISDNYYRCDKRVYHLPTDGNVVIEQSMKHDSSGMPIKQNDVYKKISGSNYFLSPYALWSIKLENERNNVTVNQFENQIIDIELIGRGQYLKNVETISRDVCNNQLDKYYFLDFIVDF